MDSSLNDVIVFYRGKRQQLSEEHLRMVKRILSEKVPLRTDETQPLRPSPEPEDQ